MKRCHKCNFQNNAMIDYCWQCGTLLANVSAAGNYYQSAPPTQAFRLNEEYDFRNQSQNFSAYQNYSVPRNQKPVKTSNTGRIVVAVAAIFLFLITVSGAGAGVLYAIFHREPVKPVEVYRERTVEPVRVESTENDTNRAKSSVAQARFDKLWVDYDVTENGRFGMRVHVKFSVDNMKGVDSYLAVHFAKSDGTKLLTTNRKFADKTGQVAVYRALKPGFDETVYSDLEVFMPYDEFRLSRGKYALKMDVDVIRPSGELVDHLTFSEFEYEKNK